MTEKAPTSYTYKEISDSEGAMSLLSQYNFDPDTSLKIGRIAKWHKERCVEYHEVRKELVDLHAKKDSEDRHIPEQTEVQNSDGSKIVVDVPNTFVPIDQELWESDLELLHGAIVNSNGLKVTQEDIKKVRPPSGGGADSRGMAPIVIRDLGPFYDWGDDVDKVDGPSAADGVLALVKAGRGRDDDLDAK